MNQSFIEKYQFTPATLQTFEKLSDISIKSDDFKTISEALKDYYIMHTADECFVGMPVEVIDHLWHAHILDTNEYHKFCKKAFGKYLHHQPFVKGVDKDEEDHANQTLEKLLETGNYPKMSYMYKTSGGKKKKNGTNGCGSTSCSSGCKSDGGSSCSSGCGGGCGGWYLLLKELKAPFFWKIKKLSNNYLIVFLKILVVPRGGFEPPTQAFSGPCSTPELPRHCF